MNSHDDSIEFKFRHIDTDGKLSLPMCRDARKLRDSIINLVIKHNGLNANSPLIYEILNKYDPLNYSIPVMRSYGDRIFQAIDKSTSIDFIENTKQLEELSKNISKAGKKGHSKRKDIDWKSVASCDDQWWISNIEIKPSEKRPEQSSTYQQNINLFANVYKLFEYWLIDDYNRSSLFTIHNIAMNFSSEEVEICMDMVPDKSKRSPEYLYRVLERRQKILISDLKETKEMDERSKLILMNLLNLAKQKTDDVDFQKMYKELEDIDTNNKTFNKVKLT